MIPLKDETKGTICGIAAIFLWGTAIASFRGNTEDVGIFSAGAYVSLAAGVIGLAFQFIRTGKITSSFKLPISYLLICGYLFVQYIISFYLAIGISLNYQDVIKVTIINYLWPSLTLIFSILLFRKKVRSTIIPGIFFALSGALIAIIQNAPSWGALFLENSQQNYGAYSLAFIAAISWALYSNLVKKYAGNSEGNAVPFFFLLSGFILFFLKFLFKEPSIHWTMTALIKLLYTAIFPGILAYVFWDISMRKGNMTFVTALSYFIPLLSTIITALYFSISLDFTIWIACSLIIAGAYICNNSITES